MQQSGQEADEEVLGDKSKVRPAQAKKTPLLLSARDARDAIVREGSCQAENPVTGLGSMTDRIVKLRPRGRRKLAGVKEVPPGEDGLVGTLKVWTSDSELVRPVSELCLREASA